MGILWFIGMMFLVISFMFDTGSTEAIIFSGTSVVIFTAYLLSLA